MTVGQQTALKQLGRIERASEGRFEILATRELEDKGLIEVDVSISCAGFPSAPTGLRLRERERGLIGKIEQALQKIEEGIYGECESCGEAISMKRIAARPVAELCIDCKAEQEALERRNA